MKAQIDNLATGFAPDSADILLPDGVFTDARNFRFRSQAAEKAAGTQAVFGSLSSTAIWLSNVTDGLTQFWTYGNESVLYATDGITHANISSISFAATLDLGYTGGAFHGFMIANDSVHTPQSWIPGLGNKLQPLPNWPGALVCQVMRPYKDFLIALRCTEGGIYNPRLLRWSDIAGIAGLPQTWDYTDPTNSSGRTELGQTTDALVDCLPLGDNNILYKANSTWIMLPIGGTAVFDIKQIFGESGLLTEDCVKSVGTGTQHFVVTDSDVIVHDGANVTSLVEGTMRRWLFNQISTSMFARSFVVADYKEKEMWFCFPTSSDSFPTLALVWDWSANSVGIRELGSPMSAGASGLIGGTAAVWSSDTDTWATASDVWDKVNFSSTTKRMLLSNGTTPRAYQGNTSQGFDGAAMTSYAVRSNMGLTKDVGSYKRVQAVYPKVHGTIGDDFLIRVGGADNPDGPVNWTPYNTFVIGTDFKVNDCRADGRFISIDFRYVGMNAFRMIGFDLEFDRTGNR